MAVRVELRLHGRVVDGVDEWWDDMELFLPEDASTRFPLIHSVDPYGEVALSKGDLAPLVVELEGLRLGAPERLRHLIEKLISLCAAGLEGDVEVELRFLGD